MVLKDGWSFIRDLKRRVVSSWHFKMGKVSHSGLTSWVVSWHWHHERGIDRGINRGLKRWAFSDWHLKSGVVSQVLEEM